MVNLSPLQLKCWTTNVLGAAVLPGGPAVLPPGPIFAEIFLSPRFVLAFPLWFESFLGVPYVYDIDKLPQQRIINAKRRRHQGLDIPPPSYSVVSPSTFRAT